MPISARVVVFTAALVALAPSVARAQTDVYVEVGAALPSGAFAAVATTGLSVGGGLALHPGTSGLGIGGEVSYARADHAAGSAQSDLIMGMAWASYRIRALEALDLEPWVGMGALTHSRRSSDYPGLDTTRAGLATKLGIRASTPIGRARVFVSGGYLLGLGALRSPAFPTDFATVEAGVALPL